MGPPSGLSGVSVVDVGGGIEFLDESSQVAGASPLLSAGRFRNVSFNQTFDPVAFDTAPRGMFFRADGMALFFVGATGDNVYGLELTIAWDISTLIGPADTFSVSSELAAPVALHFRPDGLRMFVQDDDGANPETFQYDLSVAWDVTTAIYRGISFDAVAQIIQCAGMTLSANGRNLYLSSTTPQGVYRYSLRTPWDLSSVVFEDSNPIASVAVVGGIGFRADGAVMYIGEISFDLIVDFVLSTPWDTSTAVSDQFRSVANDGNANPFSMVMSTYNHKFYFVDGVNNLLVEYDVTGDPSPFRESRVFTGNNNTGALGLRGLYPYTGPNAAATLTISAADIARGSNINPWVFTVKDQNGFAAVGPILITTEGPALIDGAGSISITSNFGAVTLYADGDNLFTL